MQCSINQLYTRLHQKAYEVYDVFKNFFGEEYVDMQEMSSEISLKNKIKALLKANGVDANDDYDFVHDLPDDVMQKLGDLSGRRSVIYVWWPKVTVTNEYGRSIVIQDLYAKIVVQFNGTIPYEFIGFQLNRATYPKEQFFSDYLHSHIQGIPKDDFTEFKDPCLGRGPIRNTINTLKTDFDIVEWMLFCQELSLYVSVESVSGGPWRRMESVGSAIVSSPYSGYDFEDINIHCFTRLFPVKSINDFIVHYLKHGHLAISYRNGRFVCSMSYYDFIIDISNSFIDYYNKHLRFDCDVSCDKLFQGFSLLKRAIASNGKFYQPNSQLHDIDILQYQNKPVLNFKGKSILTHIIENDVEQQTFPVTLIDNRAAMYILKNILKVINYRYRNEYNNNNSNRQASETSSACQRTIYI